jgi:hypothetical protein
LGIFVAQSPWGLYGWKSTVLRISWRGIPCSHRTPHPVNFSYWRPSANAWRTGKKQEGHTALQKVAEATPWAPWFEQREWLSATKSNERNRTEVSSWGQPSRHSCHSRTHARYKTTGHNSLWRLASQPEHMLASLRRPLPHSCFELNLHSGLGMASGRTRKYVFIHLFNYMYSICNYLYISIYLPIYPILSIYLSIYLPIYLSLFLSIYLIYRSIHQSIHPPIDRSVDVSIYVSI